MARRKRRRVNPNSDKAVKAYMNRSIGRRLRLRKRKPRNKKYAYKNGRYLRGRKRKASGRRRSSGRRPGPKKGYKQTAQHIRNRIASRRRGKGWPKRRVGATRRRRSGTRRRRA